MNLEKKITSVEVAEMMEVKHYQILEKLEGTKTMKGIIPTLTNHKIMVSDYFQEDTYKDGSGKENKCYLFTKLGCDYIANKFTGEKGILFTAKYVKKFREMEEKIHFTPLTKKEEMKLYIEALEEQDAKIEKVNNDLQEFKQDMPLLALECGKITNTKNRVVVNLLGGKESAAYKDNSIRGQVYRDLEKQLKREFGVDTYKAIKRNQCDIAVQIINSYKLPMFLDNLVTETNSQISFA